MQRRTLHQLWHAQPPSVRVTGGGAVKTGYGLGWALGTLPGRDGRARAVVSHAGGAVGGSSILLLLPHPALGVQPFAALAGEGGETTLQQQQQQQHGPEAALAVAGDSGVNGEAEVARGSVRPRGVCVSVLVNLENVRAFELALQLALMFEEAASQRA